MTVLGLPPRISQSVACTSNASIQGNLYAVWDVDRCLQSNDDARFASLMNVKSFTFRTSMNAHSSRSHAVLSIAVHKATIPGTAEDDPVNISARMSLVDLAGSERQESTGATGAQLKEGAS